MKQLLRFITALLMGLAMPAWAQTNTVSPPAPPATPGWLSSLDLTATNWVIVGFGSKDLTKKTYGGGGAALYTVTPNFWTGVRWQSVGKNDAAAGVQGQLQATVKLFGAIDVTPFVQTSVGMGKSSLYAEAGPGAVVGIHTWTIGTRQLGVGIIGDYEHYVFGSADGEQVNLGLLLHLKF